VRELLFFDSVFALARCGLELPWWAAGAAMGLLLKPMLAWAMLKSEVQAVEAALAQGLDAGRERLACCSAGMNPPHRGAGTRECH